MEGWRVAVVCRLMLGVGVMFLLLKGLKKGVRCWANLKVGLGMIDPLSLPLSFL